MVASGGFERFIIVWDIGSRRLLKKISCPSPVEYLTFTPSGDSILVCCEDGDVREYSIHNGQLAKTFHHSNDKALKTCLSPDGAKLLAVGQESIINVFDYENATLLQAIQAHDKAIWDVVVSPDGSRFMTGSSDATARVFDWKGNEVVMFQAKSSIWTTRFGPDGRNVYIGCGDGTISKWSVPN